MSLKNDTRADGGVLRLWHPLPESPEWIGGGR